MPVPVFLSVHDVTPQTMAGVRRLLDQLSSIEPGKIQLLVVPGLNWNASELDQLQQWQQAGFEFSGHGRFHRCERIHGFNHRMHSWLISRNVAEHLALDTAGIESMIVDCHAWFGDHDLKPPKWYVPPAWAMGKISRPQLAKLPFRYYEFQTGVLDSAAERFYRCPLVGFEGDTQIRATFLRMFNLTNRLIAKCFRRPLRISIHPNDLDLKLKSSMLRLFDQCHGTHPNWQPITAEEWFSEPATAQQS